MFAIVAAFLFSIAFVGLVSLALALPVMYLFNYVGPSVFHLGEINFWQALCLLILCGLLFKSGSARVRVAEDGWRGKELSAEFERRAWLREKRS